ncbi:protein KTI12 homolog [Patella vulgata]|uniref:protein KTI12 homolog n=1 Tax=Patella vulgata TaxID=6465 RepID=UPI00217F96D4|nr:protein KTI12 homolog [Patella vulgata]
MPLVIICGLPCSGKTKRTNELKEYLCENEPSRSVHVVTDDPATLKNDVYSDSQKEKISRGNLKSAVQRLLNKDDFVILDSLNYIKGFRYELYCVTKSCQTPHCVVLCDISPEKAAKLNEDRDKSEKYETNIFEGLVQRFEEPISTNRWDSPLITVQSEDTLPCKNICDAVLKRKPPPPNMSTQCQPLSSTNFLYELDKRTQEIVNDIMSNQKLSVVGDSISITGATDTIQFNRNFSLAELQRYRRQFITYSKMHPVDDANKISNMFVQYLNKSLQ